MRALLLSLCLALSALASAGTFEVFASVDRDRVELGESLQFRLGVKVDGQLDFPPQLQTPSFEGFEARGPQQSQNMSWVNGAMKMEQALTWELVAIKSGTLNLGPYTISAKTASAGEIIKKTPLIRVVVSKPKGLKFPGAMPQPQPTLDVSRLQDGPEVSGELRDIKPDRPFPWHWAVLGALTGLGLLFALLTWWRRQPKKLVQIPVRRNPAQWALEQIEKARQRANEGLTDDHVVEVADLLKQYHQQRFRLDQELTLTEALKVAMQAVPWTGLQGLTEERDRLYRLLYGGQDASQVDSKEFFAVARNWVLLVETALGESEELNQLLRQLKNGADEWRAGRRQMGWNAMRSAFMRFLKSRQAGKGPEEYREILAKSLAQMETPELIDAADVTFESTPPDDWDADLAVLRLTQLARALEAALVGRNLGEK